MKLESPETLEHYIFLYETRRNPDVDKWLLGIKPEDYTMHVNYIKSVQGKKRKIFIAVKHEKMIGYFQLYNLQFNQVEVGFVIHPAYQGKGYGKELVNNALLYIANNFKNIDIVLVVMQENTKAFHIYEQLGFEVEKIVDKEIHMRKTFKTI